MKNVVWATDIHLDFLKSPQKIEEFAKKINSEDAECVFLTGDISTSEILDLHLTILDQVIDKLILFVLGNHDFYHGSIFETREAVRQLVSNSKHLKYLTLEALPTQLHDNAYVIGHDGWYDFGYGFASPSRFIMNDWIYTSEFAMTVQKMGKQWIVENEKIVKVSRSLAHQAVDHFKKLASHIPEGAELHILTHVPPFRESSKHLGKLSDDEAAGVFTSKVIGDVILEIAPRFARVDVWAGHTHDPASSNIVDNVFSHVQGAKYKFPSFKTINV